MTFQPLPPGTASETDGLDRWEHFYISVLTASRKVDFYHVMLPSPQFIQPPLFTPSLPIIEWHTTLPNKTMDYIS